MNKKPIYMGFYFVNSTVYLKDLLLYSTSTKRKKAKIKKHGLLNVYLVFLHKWGLKDKNRRLEFGIFCCKSIGGGHYSMVPKTIKGENSRLIYNIPNSSWPLQPADEMAGR